MIENLKKCTCSQKNEKRLLQSSQRYVILGEMVINICYHL